MSIGGRFVRWIILYTQRILEESNVLVARTLTAVAIIDIKMAVVDTKHDVDGASPVLALQYHRFL